MLGDNIRRIRLDHHLSQAAFGRLFFVSQSAVSQWEQGITCPDTNQLLSIANAFHISLDELTRDEPIPSFREFSYLPVSNPLSSSEEELVRDYRSLNQTGRTRLRSIMDEYLLIYQQKD